MTFNVLLIINIVAAARELTRGLCFASELVPLGKSFLGTPLNEYPTIDENGDLRRTLQKPFIFDSLLYNGIHSVGEYANRFSSFQGPLNATKNEYLNYLILDSTTRNAAWDLHLLMTSKKLETRGPHGYGLLMKTSTKYQRVSDVADNYWDTEDFLMTSKSVRGITLRAKLQSPGIYSLYGVRTLAVLEGMGYATSLNPQMLEFEKATIY